MFEYLKKRGTGEHKKKEVSTVILTVTLTPALDKTVVVPGFAVGKVNRIQSMRLDAGGKGINVSKTLRALGQGSVACGILGGANGAFIRESLEKAGIECDFESVAENTRTNLKMIDPENRSNTDINEAGAPASAETLARVLERVEARLTQGDLVVLAGKAPQGAPDTLFADWTRRLHAKGAKVYLDADGALMAEGVKASPELIKPNDEELARLMGRDLATVEEMARAALELTARGVGTAVVSMGGAGALFVRGGAVLRGRGLKVPVQSTVGAGDSMMACMCYGEATGMPFDETCRLAMAVSAATVMCSGTQAAAPEHIAALKPQVVLEEMGL